MKLILASASPRRAEILRAAGIPFETMPADIDESRRPGESVETMVLRLAEAKARTRAARSNTIAGPAIVIGADTVVDLEGEALGKPGSALVAAGMLRKLSGKTHRVLTGLALVRLPDGEARVELEVTQVRFAPLSDVEVAQYAATEEPLDKAGAYAIQGLAGRFVERIDGCYFNVVGLPLARLYRMLKQMGWQPEAENEKGGT